MLSSRVLNLHIILKHTVELSARAAGQNDHLHLALPLMVRASSVQLVRDASKEAQLSISSWSDSFKLAFPAF